MSDVVISARGLGKRYRIWTHSRPTSLSDRVSITARRLRGRAVAQPLEPLREEIWALRDVSFDVRQGEVLGVIGPNGAGKSTLLSILASITDPTEGSAELHGRVSSLLEVGTGFHPELSGRDNVFLNGAVLGMTRAETAAKFDEIVEFSGVRDFIDVPVKRYSTGMYVRLAFSVAAHLDPEILLLDEVFAVGDRAFQEKCLERITEMTRSGRTVVFVSHDVSSVARLCDQAIVLNEGALVFQGSVDDAIARYLSSRSIGDGKSADEEREGTGAARITRVEVVPEGGRDGVRANRPVAIRVGLTASDRLRGDGLRLTIGIHASLGGEYVTVSTDFDPERPLAGIDLGDGATVVCEIDELPLKPGTYWISATLHHVGGEIVDRATRQSPFAIVPTDYFGTGVIPGENHTAPVLVRHRWNVERMDVPVVVGEHRG
ncbi:MAG TPA: ABC transporter ATP-binding protein [Gaiellaceae bacterium]